MTVYNDDRTMDYDIQITMNEGLPAYNPERTMAYAVIMNTKPLHAQIFGVLPASNHPLLYGVPCVERCAAATNLRQVVTDLDRDSICGASD